MAKKSDPPLVAETVRFNLDDVPDPEAFPRQFGSLLVIQGPDMGLHVLCDRPVTLGRDLEIELTLMDGSISRQHCQVELDERSGNYFVRDLQSTNGTRLNGERLEEPTPLREGDKIFLGSTVVKFGYSDKYDVEYFSQLERWVRTDALTGLLARRQFDVTFHHEVDRATTLNHELALLVMDMDGLKQINDTHGHEFGGFSIVEVAKIIQEVLRPFGQTCRWGGDEFISVLPSVSKEKAGRLAEEIRNRIVDHDFIMNDVVLQPTISIGVGVLPEDGTTCEDLFRVADRALYKAKAAGRNQVVS